jgi:hypothetical protein
MFKAYLQFITDLGINYTTKPTCIVVTALFKLATKKLLLNVIMLIFVLAFVALSCYYK